MAIVIKNKELQDLSTLVPPREEKKMNTVDERIVNERFNKRKNEITKNDIVVEPTTQEQKTLNRKFVIHKKELKGVASAENSLLVNGKQKHIGRKSHYLLDMLTLDDE